MKTHYSFQNLQNRNRKAKELQQQGLKVRKHSIRNQNCHPQYVDDWERPVETGFGNTQYQMFFAVLYCIDVDYSY